MPIIPKRKVEAKNNNIIGSIPRPHLSVASEISNATERSGIQPAPPPPPPSMEMIREMKKIMTDPKQFAMILNNKQNMEDMYRSVHMICDQTSYTHI